MSSTASGPKSFAGLYRWLLLSVFSGMTAGVFDALYFTARALLRDQSPLRPLHNIAAFWLGNASFSGGVKSAILGIVTHFALSVSMAAIYAAIALNWSSIRNRPMIFGAIYGVFLYYVMYYIVMAVRWPTLFPRFEGVNTGITIIVHIVFGIIIAFVVLKGDRKKIR